MLQKLNIRRGLEKALERDMKNGSNLLSTVDFDFQMPDEGPWRQFRIPTDIEGLVTFLFDISLGKTIEVAYRARYSYTSEMRPLRGYMFIVSDSESGSTNITPEFMDAIKRFGEKLEEHETA